MYLQVNKINLAIEEGIYAGDFLKARITRRGKKRKRYRIRMKIKPECQCLHLAMLVMKDIHKNQKLPEVIVKFFAERFGCSPNKSVFFEGVDMSLDIFNCWEDKVDG